MNNKIKDKEKSNKNGIKEKTKSDNDLLSIIKKSKAKLNISENEYNLIIIYFNFCLLCFDLFI